MRAFLFRLFAFSLLVLCANYLIGYWLASPKREAVRNRQYFEILRWDDFYKQPPQSIDMLIVGSSHAYRSINPQILDTQLGLKTFNLGSSGQSMITAYFSLREAFQTQDPKYVVLEMYPYAFYNTDQLRNGGYCYDGMHWGPAKRDFLLFGFSPDDQLSLTLLPARRYRSNWRSMGLSLLRHLSKDSPLEAESGVLDASRGEYLPKGYVRNDATVSASDLLAKNHFDGFKFTANGIPDVNLRYFENIVRLCKENDKKLVLIVAPLPRTTYAKLSGMEEFDRWLAAVASNHDLMCLNDLSGESLSLVDTRDFFDHNHLNSSGAAIYSIHLASELKKRLHP